MPCNEEPFEAAFIAASGRAWTGLDEAIVGMGQMLGAQRRGELYPWDLFRRSKFYGDLKSSRRAAEFESLAAGGDYWSPTKEKRTLPPEFWAQCNWTPVKSPIGLAIRDQEAHVDYINGVVRWADAPAAEAKGPPETHSGSPGRPTSRHLYEAELERRHVAGEMLAQLDEEAAALLAWVKATHPMLNAGSPRTIENNIRDRHRALKATTK